MARLDGPLLTVWNKRMTQAYTLPELTGVTVQRYDTRGAVKAGILLTALGAAMTAGGAILFAQVSRSHDALPYIGIPTMFAGIGLGVGGIPLIVVGNR